MAKICVVGAGKIGKIVNAFLKREKHEVFLIDANTEIKNSEASEDLQKNFEIDIQNITDQYISKADEIFSLKEKEILTV